MQRITIQEVEYIGHRLTKEFAALAKLVPNFSNRPPYALENALITPFQRSSGKSLYPSLISKAAILFYLMIKNHPFQNGNKRIALTTLYVFLHKNGKWLKADSQGLYNFTLWVAQSPAELKDQVASGIEKFIKTHLVNL